MRDLFTKSGGNGGKNAETIQRSNRICQCRRPKSAAARARESLDQRHLVLQPRASGEVSRQTTGLVFCDDRLPDGTYRDLLTLRQTGQRSLCFVVTTRVGEWDEYLEATQLGAFDVIPFPLRATDVELTVIRAMRREEQKAGYMTA